MKRLIYQSLIKWVNDVHRRPLILRGARQVGKTFVVRELGKTFNHYVEVNF
ncbi:MAG: ATPase, partial [Gammaproteobacteria bacterium]|nr:ATPase [Gammaproteobacteria bacterium]